ncbi:MAG: hypothetical protein D6798_10860 [Deltaproteobacteria bacterium]|nr:MAG: hypothetical protein D6798_10860 [Deltaproteobacteria bacterium]
MTPMIALAMLLATTACRPDDVGDSGGSESTDGGSATPDGGAGGDGGAAAGDCAALSITGDWISQGDDISPLFQQPSFDYVSIEATFGGDCSYRVQATTGGGDTYEFVGTYSATEGSPGTIVQWQSQPFEGTSEGIWQVDGTTLTLEVVLTTPDYGFTPPSPEAGFGSTAGQGLAPGDNVQVYRRP